MTDRERELIALYLPSPRDPDLAFDEYYVQDARERAVKVVLRGIASNRYDETVYQVTTPSGQFVHGPYEQLPDVFGGSWYPKGTLYDNRDDCKACCHSWYEKWEDLRALQQKEMDDS